MDDLVEKVARAFRGRGFTNKGSKTLAHLAIATIREEYAIVPRLAKPEMIAAVVTQIGDPLPKDNRIGEQACALLGNSSASGELAASEVARDYRAMIDAGEVR